MPAEIMNFSCGPSSRFNPDPEAKENGKMQAFLRLQWRKSSKCSFTAVQTAGKLQLHVFLLSQRRKTGRCSFTAPCSGGKVADWFPSVPLPYSVSFLSLFSTCGAVGHTRTLRIVFSRAMRASSWWDSANGSSERATHGGCR
ncbi:hypothetical protein AAC387_Pa03g3238 [Persea americana]